MHGSPSSKVRPKLLMVCHMPPPVHGAAVMGLAAARSKQLHARFDITVVPIQVNAGLSSPQGFDWKKVSASLRLWAEVLRAIVTNRPSAMYLTANVSGFAFWRDLMIVLLCRLAGVTRVFHLHMKGLKQLYDRSRVMRAAYRVMFQGADVVHLSPLLYGDVKPVVPVERFHVVANGLEISPTHSGARADREPTVLFLSNLYESKGPLDLLEASRRLMADGVRHRLVFAGAETEPDVVRHIREAGDHVSWVGAVGGSRKTALLEQADIFAFPSYYHFECQPLVLIEAMAYGKAIVASDEGAIPDLIAHGETGLIVRRRAVDELAASLKDLLLGPELRARLGGAAQVRYRQAFTRDVFERRLADTLWEICAEERVRAARPAGALPL